MEKFSYSPGMPGYGSKGTDGSTGLSGLAIYVTDYDATSVLGINKLTTRIANQQNLLSAEPPPFIYDPLGESIDSGRRYQNNDLFVDSASTIYAIRIDDSPPWTTTGMSLGGGTSIFFDKGTVVVGGKTYHRYANATNGETQSKLIDSYISASATTDYLNEKGPQKNYNISLAELGNISYNDLVVTGITGNYNTFNLWSAASDPLGSTDANAISLIRNTGNNNWRLGNTDIVGAIRTTVAGPTLSLDFNKIGINRSTTLGPPNYPLELVGDVSISGQLNIMIPSGTAPFVVKSTTQVANLNAANASTATYAGNITGGLATQMLWQSAPGVTSFTNASAVNGAVMTLVGGTTPTWSAPATGGTVTSVGTDGTALTGGPITVSGTITHTTTSGYKHIPAGGTTGNLLTWSADGVATWSAPATSGTVTNIATSTGITGGPISSSGTISHISGDPWNHIPTGGSSSQILQYQSSGLAQWYTPPWTTNTGTVTSIAATDGITGGTITTSGTLGLGNITPLTITCASSLIVNDGAGAQIIQVGHTPSPSYDHFIVGRSFQGINSTNRSTFNSRVAIYGDFTVYGNTACASAMICYETVTATNFILSSDERLKENIKTIPSFPINIEYKEFNLISDPSQKRYGVIAQSIEKNYPELVRFDKNGMLSVAYIDLLILEVNNLKERVKELERKVK